MLAQAARLHDLGGNFTRLSADWTAAAELATETFLQQASLGREDPLQLRTAVRELPAVAKQRVARGTGAVGSSAALPPVDHQGQRSIPPVTAPNCKVPVPTREPSEPDRTPSMRTEKVDSCLTHE